MQYYWDKISVGRMKFGRCCNLEFSSSERAQPVRDSSDQWSLSLSLSLSLSYSQSVSLPLPPSLRRRRRRRSRAPRVNKSDSLLMSRNIAAATEAEWANTKASFGLLACLDAPISLARSLARSLATASDLHMGNHLRRYLTLFIPIRLIPLTGCCWYW